MEWDLRKCAAAALDVPPMWFGVDLLNVLLILLKDKPWSSDWLQRESGILALGAMAEGTLSTHLLYGCPLRSYSASSGCTDAIEHHLPTLIPYLINMLNDPRMSRTGPFVLCCFRVTLTASYGINKMHRYTSRCAPISQYRPSTIWNSLCRLWKA